MSWKLLRTWLEYLGFRAAACLLQMLSPQQTVALARGIAWIVVDVLPRKWTRYRVAYDNISRAMGVPAVAGEPRVASTGTAKRPTLSPFPPFPPDHSPLTP
ncbi:MAG: hypothetical protein KF861_08180, partial [Planctomycetaceae bacterium]|nr:hypothetical protein [Planctomycetaceae bacterium]